MQNLLAVKGYRCATRLIWQHAHREAVGTINIQTIFVATQQIRSLLITMRFVKCGQSKCCMNEELVAALGERAFSSHAPDRLAHFSRKHQRRMRQRHRDALVKMQQATRIFTQQVGVDQIGNQRREGRLFGEFRRIELVEKRKALREQMAAVLQRTSRRLPVPRR